MDFRNLENSIEFSDDQLIKRIIFSNEQILSFKFKERSNTASSRA
jgi:hypothetical protein